MRVLNVQKGETDSHGPLTTTTRSLALHDNRRIVLTNAKIRSNEPVATCEYIYPRIVRHRRAHEKWQNYQNSNGSGKIRNKVARIDGVQAPFNDEILPRGSLMSITLATSRYNEAWWTFPLRLSVFPIDEHAAKLRPRENNRWQEGGIGFLRARSLPALFIALIHLAWLFFLCIKRMERGWKCDGLDPSYSELVIPVSFEAFVYSMDLARLCLDVYPFLRAFRPFKRIIVVFQFRILSRWIG